MRDDGHTGWLVMQPSQRGELPMVIAADFDTVEEAQAWIEADPDLWPYLPYVEAA